MRLHPTLTASFLCWAPGTVEEVSDRIRDAIGDSRLTGWVEDDGRFKLQRPGLGRNSWRPRMRGTLVPASDGVLIDVHLDVDVFVKLFTFVHGLLLFGLAWIMGIGAFSHEVPRATEALAAAVGATATGDAVYAMQELSDPADPGAAGRAPWSLRARSDVDQVAFELRGPRGLLGLVGPPSVILRVGAAGIALEPTTGPAIEVGWGELRTAEERTGPALLLTRHDGDEIEIRCDAHPGPDLTWLAGFLSARIRARGGDPGDRERVLRELGALADRLEQ